MFNISIFGTRLSLSQLDGALMFYLRHQSPLLWRWEQLCSIYKKWIQRKKLSLLTCGESSVICQITLQSKWIFFEAQLRMERWVLGLEFQPSTRHRQTETGRWRHLDPRHWSLQPCLKERAQGKGAGWFGRVLEVNRPSSEGSVPQMHSECPCIHTLIFLVRLCLRVPVPSSGFPLTSSPPPASSTTPGSPSTSRAATSSLVPGRTMGGPLTFR